MTPLTPLLIRTFGRTGSTLLMQVLGTSERICFERQYPFEHRYLTYVHNVARVIGAKYESHGTWNNDVLFQGREPHVGSLPYGETAAIDRKRLGERSYHALWDEFSASMRERQGLAADEVAYYAEKSPHKVADLANERLLAKNVFLLRDPRDEMVSVKSFNAKRGFNGFGWQDSDDDASYARRLCRNRRTFLQHLTSFETSHRRIAVRYEDLIRDGERTVERLSDWLGTPMSLERATANKAIEAQHMTSKDPAASVERWRRELDPGVQRIFAAELGEELGTLGYPV